MERKSLLVGTGSSRDLLGKVVDRVSSLIMELVPLLSGDDVEKEEVVRRLAGKLGVQATQEEEGDRIKVTHNQLVLTKQQLK